MKITCGDVICVFKLSMYIGNKGNRGNMSNKGNKGNKVNMGDRYNMGN